MAQAKRRGGRAKQPRTPSPMAAYRGEISRAKLALKAAKTTHRLTLRELVEKAKKAKAELWQASRRYRALAKDLRERARKAATVGRKLAHEAAGMKVREIAKRHAKEAARAVIDAQAALDMARRRLETLDPAAAERHFRAGKRLAERKAEWLNRATHDLDPWQAELFRELAMPGGGRRGAVSTRGRKATPVTKLSPDRAREWFGEWLEQNQHAAEAYMVAWIERDAESTREPTEDEWRAYEARRRADPDPWD